MNAPTLSDPVLLGDGHVMVFTANPEVPDGYESQRIGPDDEDYAYWVGRAQESAHAPRKRRRGRAATVLMALAILVLIALWRGGTFDHALYPIGLNAKECARNGFGAVFCGEELTEYRTRLQDAKEAAQEALERY